MSQHHKGISGEGIPADNNRNTCEEKYRMLIDLAVDAFFHGDHHGNLITVNDKAMALTGYSKEELLTMNLAELFPSDTLLMNPLRYDLLSEGDALHAERDLLRKDGRRVQVEMRSKAMPDGTYQSFFIDLTERRVAEQVKVASETRYRNLHMSMMDGYVFVDMQGRIIDSNSAFQTMLGYTTEELNTLTYHELTPGCWHLFEEQIVNQQILPKGHSNVYQKEYIKKDGSVISVELRTFLVKSPEGENEGMWAIVRDITERKKVEEELKKSEEKYRNIVESSPNGMHMYMLDEHDNLILTGANPSANYLLGIIHTELIGKTLEEAFPNLKDTGVPEMYKKVATGELERQAFEIPYQDERISGYYSVHVFKTSVRSITVDFSDITQRRQIEELVRRNAEQKEIMLREIHHRVKNNLAIVISLLNFQLRSNVSEEITRMIMDMQMRIRSMALIHEHLYRSENLDRIPLATYIESLSGMVLRAFSGNRVRLIHDLEQLDVSIETALPVGLIINELLTNAFKYAFPGNLTGEIQVSLAKEDDQMCLLTVKDDGIGLPNSLTMDSEKSLGLYIVRLLVEQLDGTVDIARDNGTSFIIRFSNLISR
jgi:PAS domain S-box-containing protein